MLKKNWKRQLRFVSSALLAFFIAALSVTPVLAATPEQTLNASATLAYNLKGLHHNLAVQKAYIASTYLYVTQRYGDLYVGRCGRRHSGDCDDDQHRGV